MAETTTLALKDGTTITNFPKEILNDEAKGKSIAQFARSVFGTGSTTDYSKINQAMSSGAMGIAGMGQETVPSSPSGMPQDTSPTVEEITTDKPSDFPAQMPTDDPETTAAGLLAGPTRELGPLATTTALGAAAGSIIPGVGTVAGGAAAAGAYGLAKLSQDILAPIVNKITGGDLMSATDALAAMYDRLGVERPDTEAEKMVQSIARGGAEAASSVGLGQALQAGRGLAPTVKSRVGEVLAERPAQQVVGGAMAGAGAEKGMQIAEEREMGPVGSVLLPLGLGIAGDIVGTNLVNAAEKVNRLMVTKGMDLPESAAEAIRLSQGRGEIYRSDLEEAPSIWETLAWGPKERTQRNAQRRQVIYDAMDDMGITDQSYFNRDIVDDFNKKRGDLLDQWTGEKTEVIEKLSRGGMDAPEGGNLPENAVPIPETLELIRSRSAELAALNDDSLRPLVNTLANWEGSLDNKNLVQIEFLRKRLRNQFEDPGLAAVKDDGGKLAKEVYNSLNKEMGDYIQEVGTFEDFNQWKTANTALAEMMGDFQVDALSTMIKKGKDNPDVVNQFLNSGSREQLENLYNNLSPDGRKTVQSALMTNMVKKATDLGDLSPNQFARLLEDSPATGVFFDEAQKGQLDGLQRWLEVTKKAEAPGQRADFGTQLPGERYALSRGLWGDPRIGLPIALAGKLGGKRFAQWLEKGDVRDTMIKYAAIPDKDVDGLAEFGKRLEESYRAFMASGAEERARSQKPLMED